MNESQVMERLKQQNNYIDGVIKYHEKVIQDLAAMRNENKKMLAELNQANHSNDIMRLFYETGFNSNKCNIVIAIMNPNTEVFEMFYNTGYDTTVTINYSSSSKSYVDSLFDGEWGEEPGRYIKGVQVS